MYAAAVCGVASAGYLYWLMVKPVDLFPLATYGRLASAWVAFTIIIAELVAMWYALSILVGGVTYDGVAAPIVAANGSATLITEYDLAYNAYAIAFLILIVMFLMRKFSNTYGLYHETTASRQSSVSSEARTKKSGLFSEAGLIVVGALDRLSTDYHLFTSRMYAFITGYVYMYIVLYDISDFTTRYAIAVFVGGIGGVLLSAMLASVGAVILEAARARSVGYDVLYFAKDVNSEMDTGDASSMKTITHRHVACIMDLATRCTFTVVLLFISIAQLARKADWVSHARSGGLTADARYWFMVLAVPVPLAFHTFLTFAASHLYVPVTRLMRRLVACCCAKCVLPRENRRSGNEEIAGLL